jgi:NAD(P)-dependent dehydrogenase (short-subunit alcohol dehydrogenase family)
MSDRMHDKVAIVTGGATGLGREISLLYAAEGARVVVSDVREEPGQETVSAIHDAGGEAIFIAADVTDESQVKALVHDAESAYGRLDVMTANAGTLGRGHRQTIVDISDEDARQAMEINFWGVFYAFRHAIPAITRAGGGAMTATSSTSALRGMGELSLYSASKGAVSGLVRSAAAELVPHNIRVNAVIAGPMATALHRNLAEERGLDPESAPKTAPDAVRGVSHPRQVAYLHLWLVSDEASFVNGEELRADGGRSMLTLSMSAQAEAAKSTV